MDCTTTTNTTTLNTNNNCLSNASNEANEMSTSHDEVDFVPVATTTTTNNNIINNNNHISNNKITNNGVVGSSNFNNKMSENATSSCGQLNSNLTSNIFGTTKTRTNEHLQYQQQQQQAPQKSVTKSKKKSVSTTNNNNNNNNTNDEPKKKSSAKDRLSLFSTLGRRISQKALGHKDAQKSSATTPPETEQATDAEKAPTTTTTAHTTTTTNTTPTPPRQRTFVKSSSIARLLGNTYQHHMKKFEKHQQLQQQQQHQQQQLNMEKCKPTNLDGKFHTFGGRRRPNGPYLDRFKQYSKDDGDVNSSRKDEVEGAASDAASAMDFSEILEIEANAAEELQRASSGLERFCDYSTVAAGDDEAAAELGSKTMRTLSRSLGRLWGKRLHSVEISTPDPEYKVSYLGNVLTGWAKGEGCVEKQLNTLWRNYTQNNKPDMIMRVKVCASGLKATTRQHGLTEYWANRITHCCAPKNYPRIFCWVYRHEGRKMKHELRCHAVLCSKEKVVQDICNTLKENLKRALREFKREKILKQNARLSLANAAYENPSLPRRKILLIVGGNNYRPPLERSKSAPKLMAIEEAIGEEEGEDAEETNEPEMKSCCQKDSLYPAMTLGRRRCRRGHSIRRTGKARALCSISLDESKQRKQTAMSAAADSCCHNKVATKEYNNKQAVVQPCHASAKEEEQRNSYGSDESDDFEKILKYNDYDTNASLATELLPYFDMQLHKNTSSSLSDLCELKHDEEEEPLSLPPTINIDPMAHPEGDVLPNASREARESEAGVDDETHVSLRRDGVCSDGEEDFLDADDRYFRQAAILNILHRNSMRKMVQLSLSSDEGSSSMDTNSATPLQYRHQTQSSISSNASSNATTSSMGLAPAKRHSGGDSDEGSISSGCETASTVTANQDDLSLQYRHDNKHLLQLQEQQQAALFDVDNAARFFNNMPAGDEHAAVTVDEIYQRLEARLQRRQNSDATTFSSSSTITLKMGTGSEGSLPDSPNDAVKATPNTIEDATTNNLSGTRVRRQRQRQFAAATPTVPQRALNADDTDSECSDESGYVEYREEREKTVREKVCDVERRELAQQQQQQHEHEQHPIAKQRKPQLPPKPMPRRTLSGGTHSTIVLSDQHSSNSTAV